MSALVSQSGPAPHLHMHEVAANGALLNDTPSPPSYASVAPIPAEALNKQDDTVSTVLQVVQTKPAMTTPEQVPMSLLRPVLGGGSASATSSRSTSPAPSTSPGLAPIKHVRRLTLVSMPQSLTAAVAPGTATTSPSIPSNVMKPTASSSSRGSSGGAGGDGSAPIQINRRRSSLGGISDFGAVQQLAASGGNSTESSQTTSTQQLDAVQHKLKTAQLLNSSLQRECADRFRRITELESEASRATQERKKLSEQLAELKMKLEAAEQRAKQNEAKAANAEQKSAVLQSKLLETQQACTTLQAQCDATERRAADDSRAAVKAQEVAHADLVATLATRNEELSFALGRETASNARLAQLEARLGEVVAQLSLARAEALSSMQRQREAEDTAFQAHSRAESAVDEKEKVLKALQQQQELVNSLRSQLAYAEGVGRIRERDVARWQRRLKQCLVLSWVRNFRRKKVLYDAVRQLFRTAAEFSTEIYRTVERGAVLQGTAGLNIVPDGSSTTSSSSTSVASEALGDLATESANIGLTLGGTSLPNAIAVPACLGSTTAPSGVSLSHKPIKNDKRHLNRSATSLNELVLFLAELSPRLEVVCADATKEHAYWRRMAQAFFERTIGLKGDVLDLQQQKGQWKEEVARATAAAVQAERDAAAEPSYARATLSHSRRTSLNGLSSLFPAANTNLIGQGHMSFVGHHSRSHSNSHSNGLSQSNSCEGSSSASNPAPTATSSFIAMTATTATSSVASSTLATSSSLTRSIVGPRGTFTLSGAAAAQALATKQADSQLAASAGSGAGTAGTPERNHVSAVLSQPPSPDLRARGAPLSSIARRGTLPNSGSTLNLALPSTGGVALPDSRSSSPAAVPLGGSTVTNIGSPPLMPRQGSLAVLPSRSRTASGTTAGGSDLATTAEPVAVTLRRTSIQHGLPLGLAHLPTLDNRPATSSSTTQHQRRGSFSALDVNASVAEVRAAVLAAAAMAAAQAPDVTQHHVATASSQSVSAASQVGPVVPEQQQVASAPALAPAATVEQRPGRPVLTIAILQR